MLAIFTREKISCVVCQLARVGVMPTLMYVIYMILKDLLMVTLKLPFAALLTDKALVLGSAIGTKGLGGIPGHPGTQS